MNLYIGVVAGGASQANLRDTYAAVVAVDTVTNTVTNAVKNREKNIV
jgi:hypothetical protein